MPVPLVAANKSTFVGRNQFSEARGSSTTGVTSTRAQFKLPGLGGFGKRKDESSSAKNEGAVKAAPKVKLPSVAKSVSAPSSTQKAADFSVGSKGSGASASGVKFYNSKTQSYVFKADAKGHGATAFDSRVGGAEGGTNSRGNANGTFRNMDPYTSNPVWARPGWSASEASTVTRAVLRQVLGNAHLVEEEVAELAAEVSCFKKTGETKEFIRAVALSDAYKSRFFEGMSNMRFVELNFKHFLGRAPRTQAEISEHIRTLVEEGYNAEINSYLDCDEYDTLWGDERVPQPNFRGGHDYNKDMNSLAVLQGGSARSDRFTSTALFASGDAAAANPVSILKGLPAAWRVENEARDSAGPIRSFSTDLFWNPVTDDVREGDVEWKARYGINSTNWYKDSVVFKQTMMPNLTETDEDIIAAEATLKWGSTMAKNYIGVRYQWSTAPVISIKPPTSEEASNGQVSLTMEEITFAIPSELSQSV